jgi:hypothetical protein
MNRMGFGWVAGLAMVLLAGLGLFGCAAEVPEGLGGGAGFRVVGGQACAVDGVSCDVGAVAVDEARKRVYLLVTESDAKTRTQSAVVLWTLGFDGGPIERKVIARLAEDAKVTPGRPRYTSAVIARGDGGVTVFADDGKYGAGLGKYDVGLDGKVRKSVWFAEEEYLMVVSGFEVGDGSGDVVVIGRRDEHGLVMRVKGKGEKVWERVFEKYKATPMECFARGEAGTVVVCGWAVDHNGGKMCGTVAKLDLKTGEVIRENEWVGPPYVRIGAGWGGGYLVSYSRLGAKGMTVYVRKYDEDLRLVWEKAVLEKQFGTAPFVIFKGNSGYVLAGGAVEEMQVMSLDAQGNVVKHEKVDQGNISMAFALIARLGPGRAMVITSGREPWVNLKEPAPETGIVRSLILEE